MNVSVRRKINKKKKNKKQMAFGLNQENKTAFCFWVIFAWENLNE